MFFLSIGQRHVFRDKIRFAGLTYDAIINSANETLEGPFLGWGKGMRKPGWLGYIGDYTIQL